MVFSSLTFLFIFLPCVFGLYCIIPNLKARNLLLIIFSLFFYSYGEPVYVLLMIASTVLNYFAGLLVARGNQEEENTSGRSRQKVALGFAVAANLGILAIFKYSDMFVNWVDKIPGVAIPQPEIALPIGISFFTFQAMSYVVDVYRGDVKVEKNYLNVLLYISFFPQLIAGPIVKYHDIALQIRERKQSISEISYGLRRFCIGLAKKVLVANQMAVVCDVLFATPTGELNILSAWLAAFSYMLQIYFDFSGYSDMAIGLGHMFGFTFKENFNYPYKSKSIQEFWRRWHISLSTWFLEYLYIPLGGNRKGKARTSINKIIVFFLCGLWHGASMTFVVWGLYHGAFLMLENYIPKLRKLPAGLAHVYAMVVVIFGWVLFRADSFGQAAQIMSLMVTGFTFTHDQMAILMMQITPQFIVAAVVGSVAAFPVKAAIVDRLKTPQAKTAWNAVFFAAAFVLLVICVLEVSSGAYNPFIYFRF